MANNPIQSSGPISFSDINLELGRSATAELAIGAAENGGYVSIRSTASPKPTAGGSAALSEWYGYRHIAPTISSIPLYYTVYFDNYIGSEGSNIYGDFTVSLNSSPFTVFAQQTNCSLNTNYTGTVMIPVGVSITVQCNLNDMTMNDRFCSTTAYVYCSDQSPVITSNHWSRNYGSGYSIKDFYIPSAVEGDYVQFYGNGIVDYTGTPDMG